MIAWIIAAAVIIVLGIIFSIPIQCGILISYNDDGFETAFEVKYLFFNIPISSDKERAGKNKKSDKKPETDEKKSDGSVQDSISFVRENIDRLKNALYAILGYMFKRLIKIKYLGIDVEFGTDDAMNTALMFGSIAGFVYNVVGVMDKKMRLCRHSINMKPDFNNPHISAVVKAIITTSINSTIGLAVIALIHGLPLYRSFRAMKGDKKNG